MTPSYIYSFGFLHILLFCTCFNYVRMSSDGEQVKTTAKLNKSYYNVPVLMHGRSKREVTYLGKVASYSAQEKQDIVERHRFLRSQVQPEAADMEYMYWDDDLATMGETWSSACIWNHDNGRLDNISPYDSFGQNLRLAPGSKGSPPSGVAATNAWHDNEVGDYDYDSNSCSADACGHYTQVVWAKSIYVGCGRAFCESITEGGTFTDSWIQTCHYAPAGNYIGRRPYIAGPSCTECASGSGQCFENQCRNCTRDDEDSCDCQAVCNNCGTLDEETCTCSCPNGWFGPSCNTECRNYHENCGANPGWPGPQYCDLAPSIPGSCPLMCGLCEAATGDEMCNPNMTTPARPMVVRGALRVLRKFISAFNNPQSMAFMDFAGEFMAAMDGVLEPEFGDHYDRCIVHRCRKGGQFGIMVDFSIHFRDNPGMSEDPRDIQEETAELVMQAVGEATANGTLGPIRVDPELDNVGPPRVYAVTRILEAYPGHFIGEFDITVPTGPTTRGWKVNLKFPRNVYRLRMCNAEVESKERKGQMWRLRNQPWNANMDEGTKINLWYWADTFRKAKSGLTADVVFTPIY